MSKFTQLVVAAMLGSGITIAVGQWYGKNNLGVIIEHMSETPIASVSYQVNDGSNVIPLDFTGTAKKVTPAVVHVQSTKMEEVTYQRFYNPFHNFFYNPSSPNTRKPSRSSGSGVIISNKGHIVTNYHVVQDAEIVKITLSDNSTFVAEVIGTDKDTDIALIKIDKEDLPHLSFVDSDNANVGQWVLAVGNPFNLNSTVTAGIISAKGRNINIIGSNNRDGTGDERLGNTAIESFIQTDAAINPGNSGGALVDLEGGLVGINTAIASPTGAYSGYGFAIPSNICSKVVEDLLSYGVVQRGWLGITIQSVNSDLAEREDLDINEGAYITGFADNSAAGNAGLKKGDVVIKIDDIEIKSNVALIEYVGTKRPEDKISVTVNRNGKIIVVPVVLKNKDGGFGTVKPPEKETYSSLGINLEDVGTKKLKRLGLKNGVRVSDVKKGKISRYTDMKVGFIITHVDNTAVNTVDDIQAILENKKEKELVTFAGIYEDFSLEYIYAVRM